MAPVVFLAGSLCEAEARTASQSPGGLAMAGTTYKSGIPSSSIWGLGNFHIVHQAKRG